VISTDYPFHWSISYTVYLGGFCEITACAYCEIEFFLNRPINLAIHVTVHHDKVLKIKPTSCNNFSNLFLEWNSTCFGQFLCRSPDVFHCRHSKLVWHIPLLCVEWKTPDDGQKNFPKHVEFHSNNKFEKLMHLVGFIIRNMLTTWWNKLYCYLPVTILGKESVCSTDQSIGASRLLHNKLLNDDHCHLPCLSINLHYKNDLLHNVRKNGSTSNGRLV